MPTPVPVQRAIVLSSVINQKICFLRGTRVMLDSDLAKLYGVTTAKLNQAVRRNRERFPADFMFRVKPGEAEILRSQFVMSSLGAMVAVATLRTLLLSKE